ncbi:putative deacylase [Oxalobacteraceae bacterium GrIS 1.11]
MNTGGQLHFKAIHYCGQHDGPRLIVLGAVHGNERCGTLAITRVMALLDSGALALTAGAVSFVPVANALAFAKGERIGQRNLNRNLYPSDAPQDFEDRAANWLCPLLARHDVLLDLHSFSGDGAPFVMVGPHNNDGQLEPFARAGQERALARSLGVGRCVDGWLQTYADGVRRRATHAGALEAELAYGIGSTEFMRSMGGYGVTLECGRHDDPAAPEVAYRAILNTLAHLEMVMAPPPAVADMEAWTMVAAHDKRDADDAFSRPWASFDRIRLGELIGTRADDTPVHAECEGVILFPDSVAAAGKEWYYLARENRGF